MYKVPWVDKMEDLIGPYHVIVMEILDFIKNSHPIKRPTAGEDLEVKMSNDLEIVIKELKKLKKSKHSTYNFLKVATGTNLKKYIRDLKYEEFDILQKYKDLTDNYERVIKGSYTDSTIYSESLKKAFIYLYTDLLVGQLFNESIGQKGKVAILNFKEFLTLENNICPYCDWYEMELKGVSVDHFLPKSKFPLLAIYPKNLVVSCGTCNDRIKNEKTFLPIVHPYYKDISDYIIFKLVKGKIKVYFKKGISYTEKKMVANFLKLFEIKERYNQNHVKKLEQMIVDIRQDIFEELKDKPVTFPEVEECLKKKFSKQASRINDKKRKSPLTKLKLDYLDQLNSEIKEQADYILMEINLNQKLKV